MCAGWRRAPTEPSEGTARARQGRELRVQADLTLLAVTDGALNSLLERQKGDRRLIGMA